MQSYLVPFSVFTILVLGSSVSADSCPTYCPFEFNPICGWTGTCIREFSSQCLFDYEKCSLSKDLVEVHLALCEASGAIAK